MNIIDLFSGAGGLTEGFRNPNFNILSHIEKEPAASKTLLVRDAFYYLKENNQISIYEQFLNSDITYDYLLSKIPSKITRKTINTEIGDETLDAIFNDITDSLPQNESVSGIIGGPPCQAYSMIGRAQNKHKLATDGRIYLYRYYIEFLKKFNPKFFVFENVKGLLSFKDISGKPLLEMMIKEFNDAGYHIQYEIVDASEYGVSQKRERIIIFGSTSPQLPGTFFDKLKQLKETPIKINDLFADLPAIHAGQTNNNYRKNYTPSDIVTTYYRNENLPLTWNIARPHMERDLLIYKHAAELKKVGKNIRYNELESRYQGHKNTKDFLDRYKALNGDGVSHTVVAHIAKDGHHYIHPDVEQNRSITVREAARLQSFPDDFYFENSRTSAFTQIGNAVPPILSHKIATAIKLLLI